MIKQNQASAFVRRSLTATEIVARLATPEGWTLTGDEASVAIEKTFVFDDYYKTLSFVNAVAFIAHKQNHHPDLLVQFSRCVIRFNTHDVGGISVTDFDCAALVDTLAT